MNEDNTVYYNWYSKWINKEERKSNMSLVVLETRGSGKHIEYKVGFRSVEVRNDALPIMDPVEIEKCRNS